MEIPNSLHQEFAEFVLTVPSKRLKQSITKLLFYFLKFECGERMPDFMDDLFTDFIYLFDLLDSIDREVDQTGII